MMSREDLKKQRKLVSSERSKEQLNKAGFKAKVGFIELFRSILSLAYSAWIVIKFICRDFIAFLGKLVVSLSKLISKQGKRMDWNNRDEKALEARKLSHKRF